MSFWNPVFFWMIAIGAMAGVIAALSAALRRRRGRPSLVLDKTLVWSAAVSGLLLLLLAFWILGTIVFDAIAAVVEPLFLSLVILTAIAVSLRTLWNFVFSDPKPTVTEAVREASNFLVFSAPASVRPVLAFFVLATAALAVAVLLCASAAAVGFTFWGLDSLLGTVWPGFSLTTVTMAVWGIIVGGVLLVPVGAALMAGINFLMDSWRKRQAEAQILSCLRNNADGLFRKEIEAQTGLTPPVCRCVLAALKSKGLVISERGIYRVR